MQAGTAFFVIYSKETHSWLLQALSPNVGGSFMFTILRPLVIECLLSLFEQLSLVEKQCLRFLDA
jgi:hypothetical protein